MLIGHFSGQKKKPTVLRREGNLFPRTQEKIGNWGQLDFNLFQRNSDGCYLGVNCDLFLASWSHLESDGHELKDH